MPTANRNFKRKTSIKVRLAVGVLLGYCFGNVWAVTTLTPMVTTPRRLTIQVGSAQFGTINSVTFTVNNDSLNANTAPIQGVPSATAGTAATSITNGILVRVTSEIPITLTNVWQNVKLTVDSPVGLTCISGTGCGTTVIPFNTISWVSDSPSPSAGLDIASGTFSGGTTQTLFWVGSINGGLKAENILVFSYSNNTLYPSGQYTGRVTYTASLP